MATQSPSNERVRHQLPDGYEVYFEPEGHVYSEDAEGTQVVPSVSTITSAFKDDTDGLISWGVWLSRTGLDWREERRKAALRGNLVHQSLEVLASGGQIYWDDIPDEERGYHQALENAWEELKPKPILVETVVASRTKRVAGTFDLYAELPDHGLTLIDLKTSKHIGLDYHAQIAGYEVLGRECGVIDRVDTKLILQVDKKGQYRTIHGKLDAEAFEAALSVWDIRARIATQPRSKQ